MTFFGPAEEDVKKIKEEFPRDFTHPQVMDKLGWDKAKARQAIVMGLSLDYFRVGQEDKEKRLMVYENAEWRRNWTTRRWAA